MLQRLELLGVDDAAVVHARLLGGLLQRERLDLVLERGLIARHLVDPESELPERSLCGVGLGARGRDGLARLERHAAHPGTIDRRVEVLELEQPVGSAHRGGSLADAGLQTSCARNPAGPAPTASTGA